MMEMRCNYENMIELFKINYETKKNVDERKEKNKFKNLKGLI